MARAPGFFNQRTLTEARDELGVFSVRLGITGLSQVNEIDMSTSQLLAESDAKMISEMSTPALLAKTDREMIDSMSVDHYFKYILATVYGKGSGDRVKS